MSASSVIGATVAATLIYYTGVEKGYGSPRLGRLLHVLSGVDADLTRAELAKASGLIALVLLALSLLAGPLHRLGAARVASSLLPMRRCLGVAAFLFSTTHVALSVLQLAAGTIEPTWLRALGIVLAACSVAILARMAQTSTRKAMRHLGPRWKRIHALGGKALALAVVHFFAMELDPARGLHVRWFALVVVGLAGAAWSLRLVVSTLRRRRASTAAKHTERAFEPFRCWGQLPTPENHGLEMSEIVIADDGGGRGHTVTTRIRAPARRSLS
jgi:sulfoxide reductase heme-binding subunit YedZ